MNVAEKLVNSPEVTKRMLWKLSGGCQRQVGKCAEHLAYLDIRATVNDPVNNTLGESIISSLGPQRVAYIKTKEAFFYIWVSRRCIFSVMWKMLNRKSLYSKIFMVHYFFTREMEYEHSFWWQYRNPDLLLPLVFFRARVWDPCP